jgi:hypothetical protein
LQKFGIYKIIQGKFIPYIFAAAVIFIPYFIVQLDQFRVFLSIVIVGVIFWVYRSYIGPVIFALALLFISLISLIAGDRTAAHEVAIYSFWLLLVGTLLLLIRSMVENKQDKNSRQPDAV